MSNSLFVSRAAYVSETLLFQNSSEGLADIQDEINREISNFPPHLELVDAFFCRNTGANAVAFLDTRRNEIIIGHAGTNFGKGLGVIQDLWANTQIAFGGIHPESDYIQAIDNFMERVQATQHAPITTVTGHSLGGGIAQLTGVRHNISLVFPINAAPLHGNPMAIRLLTGLAGGIVSRWRSHGQESALAHYIHNHDGVIIHFYTDSDWLMNPVRISHSPFIGAARNIGPGGHEIHELTPEQLQYMSDIEGRARKIHASFQTRDFSNLAGKLEKRDFFSCPWIRGSTMSQKIAITPESLRNVAANLRRTAQGRIQTVKLINTEIQDLNNQVGHNRSNRLETLAQNVHQFAFGQGEIEGLLNRINELYHLVDMSRNALFILIQGSLGVNKITQTLTNRYGTGRN